MCGVLALLFLVVPAAEIFVILQVGGFLGLWPTLAVIAVTAVAGAALTKAQGLVAVRKLQEAMLTGRELGGSILRAALILVAGVLMLTPGFLTDAFGFLLLVPQARDAIGRMLRRHLESRVARGDVVISGASGPFGAGARGRRASGGEGRERSGEGRERSGEGRERSGEGASKKPPIIDV